MNGIVIFGAGRSGHTICALVTDVQTGDLPISRRRAPSCRDARSRRRMTAAARQTVGPGRRGGRKGVTFRATRAYGCGMNVHRRLVLAGAVVLDRECVV